MSTNEMLARMSEILDDKPEEEDISNSQFNEINKLLNTTLE